MMDTHASKDPSRFILCLDDITQRWSHWWLRSTKPHALALFRILFGIFLLILWGQYAPSVPLLFSREGIALPLIDQGLLAPLLTPPAIVFAWLLYIIFLTSILLFTIGACFRISSVLTFLFTLYYYFLTFYDISSTQSYLTIFFLLILTFSGADRTFSYAMWRKYGSFTASENMSILPQRLIALQITALYLGVGLQKTVLPTWEDGSILWYAFQSMFATPLAFWFVHLEGARALCDVAALLVKCLHVTMPFGLWMRAVRKWFFLAGTLFHIGVFLFLGMWDFLAIPITYLLFLEPEELRRKL